MSTLFQITLTVFCAFTIIITSVMDLNATHMTNPLWPAHARFHWGIQYLSCLLMQLFALVLLWSARGKGGDPLVIMVIASAPLLFWGLFLPALLFPGTGTWPDGVSAPAGMPAFFLRFHPNMIIALVITVGTVVLSVRELKWLR